MPKNPQEVGRKWSQRTSQATQAYKDGVQAVTESPGQAALRQIDRWLESLIEARNNGTMERALNYSLEDWKRSTIDKGGARLGPGAAAAEGKMVQYMAEALPVIESIRQGLPARGDFQANMQRAFQMAEAMHKFGKQRKR